MSAYAIDTRVWVVTGYMDCQGHLMGYPARIVARAGPRLLVKDEAGNCAYLSPAELLPLPEPVLATPATH